MSYRNDWMEDVTAREVVTVVGFGTLWEVTFPSGDEDDEFDHNQEIDEREAKEEKVSKSFASRFLIVHASGKEIWTSDEDLAMDLLGIRNTLFAA